MSTTGDFCELSRAVSSVAGYSRARCLCHGAFTLVELILVLVVISVVLALSAPMLRGFFASRQTADAATMVLAMTKLAHTESVSQGRCVRLNVDSSAGACWLTVQQAGTFVGLKDDMGRRFSLPEGASIGIAPDSTGQAPAYVKFLPTGRSDAATIEIGGAGGEVYVVASDSATEPYHVVAPSGAVE